MLEEYIEGQEARNRNQGRLPMHDYLPLRLTQFCNVGTEFISEGAQPLIGSQTWHGLPFTVGSTQPNPARCFIGFDSREDTSVTIPVGAAVRYVIFAHALLESRMREGENIGRVVANYIFCFTDGQVEQVPIRERF